jgi:hypothetical protein
MKAYMLMDQSDGLYYKRQCGWVKQEEASIWPSVNGPNAAKGTRTWRHEKAIDPIVVEFDMVEVKREN